MTAPIEGQLISVQGIGNDLTEAEKWLISNKATLSSPHFWVTTLTTVSAIVGFFLHKQIDLTPMAASVALLAGAIVAAVAAIAHVIKVAAGVNLAAARLHTTRALQEAKSE